MDVLGQQRIVGWWPGTESNRRHGDFQSPALPTELPGQTGFHDRRRRTILPFTHSALGVRGRLARRCVGREKERLHFFLEKPPGLGLCDDQTVLIDEDGLATQPRVPRVSRDMEKDLLPQGSGERGSVEAFPFVPKMTAADGARHVFPGTRGGRDSSISRTTGGMASRSRMGPVVQTPARGSRPDPGDSVTRRISSSRWESVWRRVRRGLVSPGGPSPLSGRHHNPAQIPCAGRRTRKMRPCLSRR